MLDWLGDIGGLNGILLTLCETLVAPFAGFSLQRYLLTNLFSKRAVPEDEQAQKSDKYDDEKAKKESDS